MTVPVIFALGVTPSRDDRVGRGNTRRKNTDGAYTDTEAEFYDITVWGQAAPNAADSLTRGAAITATAAR